MNELKLAKIERRIFLVRGQKAMLDFDLAELYGVETRALKQAVRRNLVRFPADFMFELSATEIKNLVSQTVIPTRGKLPPLNLSTPQLLHHLGPCSSIFINRGNSRSLACLSDLNSAK